MTENDKKPGRDAETVFVHGRPLESKPLQQDDNYKEFMTWITDGGLRYACAKQQQKIDADSLYQQKVDNDCRKKVIVVGAGMSGLVAAYELAQIGHEVTVLEMGSRVGGKVKTFRDGFADGLLCEGGPMRLPQTHYLTKHYIDLFKIPTKTFQNYQPNAYMYLYGEKIRIKDFHENNAVYSDRFWKGWDASLTEEIKEQLGIKGIVDYYARSLEPVKRDLGTNPTEEKWQEWADKWGLLTVEDFLGSTVHQDEGGPKLRPWPKIAIEAYKVAFYTPTIDADLITRVRNSIGQWWMDEMYTPVSGMDALPKGFFQINEHGWNKDVQLTNNIIFDLNVEKVDLGEKDTSLEGIKSVTVFGSDTKSGQQKGFKCDAVIMAVPFHFLKKIEIPLSLEQKRAISSLEYGASAKIMLQCRTRFWQKDVGQGGCTKTTLKIGQIHYPDFTDSGISDDKRGILLMYPCGKDALSFGCQSSEEAIQDAVRQVSKVHPEIENEFEVGKIQTWYSGPSHLEKCEHRHSSNDVNNMKLLHRPTPPIYFAGEELAWSKYWIQGALFSGLMQAFLFQSNVERFGIDPITMMYERTETG